MFEVKLLVTAPGLETAINNLAAAIATGAAPLMTAPVMVSLKKL